MIQQLLYFYLDWFSLRDAVVKLYSYVTVMP